ncbi:hypothetical protein TTHERM_01349970 (macronuclear) [Tetrahymena thermophila SB210]|uniref:Uncharacterized protein n=1 Tax=Tetrahymena thermophila (strain SB210) TaxID=312017 RepID=Q235V3_TETTS|nr:hypothetical protein TTHERM_01349970 [Tetrahymena thermophila SB210]EAR92308.2 hypothetical protein TTHERM_01349970 [Tetrahymena thermophila SB210]|eukprot:XP_001012553.2 hypothetical protein TTHERM_01349970 [Tetrahymena thermophila SB210]
MGDYCQSDFSSFESIEVIKKYKTKRTSSKIMKKEKNSVSIQKRKYQKKKNITALSMDNHFLNLANTILLDSCLQVTDGILRFLPCINQLSFNFQHQKVLRIEEKHDLEVVNVSFQKSNYQFNKQKGQVIKLLNQMSNINGYCHREIYDIIERYLFIIDELMEKNAMYYSNCVEMEKGNELNQFVDVCFQKIQQIKQENESQFFFYQISKLDMEKKEQDIIHMGYSKQYLDLLGLDKDAVSQIFLRNKKIDLFQNLQDVSKQALKGIFNFVDAATENRLNKQEQFESNIVTFDGYPIKIFQKKQSACNIQIQEEKNNNQNCQFLLTVVDIDIELESLQQLIQYRQKISQQSNSQIDTDFIRRENSYLFEDVEYSVESQQFIEKFYGQNLLNLQQIQLQNDEKSKQCCYKFINQS